VGRLISSSARQPGSILAIKQSHHDIIVPPAINKGSLPFSPLNDEAAFLVRTYRPVIVVDNAH